VAALSILVLSGASRATASANCRVSSGSPPSDSACSRQAICRAIARNSLWCDFATSPNSSLCRARKPGTVIFASRPTSAAMLITFSVFSKGVNLVSMNPPFAPVIKAQ